MCSIYPLVGVSIYELSYWARRSYEARSVISSCLDDKRRKIPCVSHIITRTIVQSITKLRISAEMIEA